MKAEARQTPACPCLNDARQTLIWRKMLCRVEQKYVINTGIVCAGHPSQYKPVTPPDAALHGGVVARLRRGMELSTAGLYCPIPIAAQAPDGQVPQCPLDRRRARGDLPGFQSADNHSDLPSPDPLLDGSVVAKPGRPRLVGWGFQQVFCIRLQVSPSPEP